MRFSRTLVTTTLLALVLASSGRPISNSDTSTPRHKPPSPVNSQGGERSSNDAAIVPNSLKSGLGSKIEKWGADVTLDPPAAPRLDDSWIQQSGPDSTVGTDDEADLVAERVQRARSYPREPPESQVSGARPSVVSQKGLHKRKLSTQIISLDAESKRARRKDPPQPISVVPGSRGGVTVGPGSLSSRRELPYASAELWPDQGDPMAVIDVALSAEPSPEPETRPKLSRTSNPPQTPPAAQSNHTPQATSPARVSSTSAGR